MTFKMFFILFFFLSVVFLLVLSSNGSLLYVVFAVSESGGFSTTVNSLLEKANHSYGLGNYSQAIQYYDKVLAIDPNNINSLQKKVCHFIS